MPLDDTETAGATPDWLGDEEDTSPGDRPGERCAASRESEKPPVAELARGESGTPRAGGWWVVGTTFREARCAGLEGSDSLF